MSIFVFLLGLTIAQLCDNKKNWKGQPCDYKCEIDACVCPTGWRLAAEGSYTNTIDVTQVAVDNGGVPFLGNLETGHKCYPADDQIDVTCRADRMTVEFTPDIFDMEGSIAGEKHLFVGACSKGNKITWDAARGRYVADFKFTHCGIIPFHNPHTMAHIHWEVAIHCPDQVTGVILKQGRQIKVGCRMPMFSKTSSSTTVSEIFLNQEHVTGETSSLMPVSFNIDSFSDPARVLPANDFNTGDVVYMRATRTQIPYGTSTLIKSCDIADQTQDPSGQLSGATVNIVDKCVTQTNLLGQAVGASYVTQPTVTDGSTIDFSYRSFMFKGAVSGTQHLVGCTFIHCVTGQHCDDLRTSICPSL